MSIEESKLDSYLVYALMMSGISEWGMQLNEQDKHIYGIRKLDLKDIFNQTSVDKLKAMFEEEDEKYEVSLQEELDMLDEAYHNAYLVATKKLTITELLEADGEMVLLPFNPESPETIIMVIDDVINYFSKEEEYEKCAELVRVKKRLQLNDV